MEPTRNRRAQRTMKNTAFCSKPYVVGGKNEPDRTPYIPAEETLAKVLSNVWWNSEYKHLIVKAWPKALAAKPGQFFNILCPSPDDGDLWLRRPQSVYRIDRKNGMSSSSTNAPGAAPRAWPPSRPAANATWWA